MRAWRANRTQVGGKSGSKADKTRRWGGGGCYADGRAQLRHGGGGGSGGSGGAVAVVVMAVVVVAVVVVVVEVVVVCVCVCMCHPRQPLLLN